MMKNSESVLFVCVTLLLILFINHSESGADLHDAIIENLKPITLIDKGE